MSNEKFLKSLEKRIRSQVKSRLPKIEEAEIVVIKSNNNDHKNVNINIYLQVSEKSKWQAGDDSS